MLKSKLIIQIHHITHVSYLGRLSGANFSKADFQEKTNQWNVVESMKFTHKIDSDMVKIIDEVKVDLIYYSKTNV